MKIIFTIFILLAFIINAEELTVIADSVEGDEVSGVSFFKGHVRMKKGRDELNASIIYIYTNKNRKPIKYKASGGTSFKIYLDNGAIYRGEAKSVEYHPEVNEYRFLNSVRLEQLDEKKVVIGERVIVNIKNGTALAEGNRTTPVTMIFNIKDKNNTK